MKIAWIAVLVGLSIPTEVSAQTVSLDFVENLVAEGNFDRARTVLRDWWVSEFAGSDRIQVQRALWLRGTLTLDADMAANDFRRLVIEYPGGPYSDRASLRLGQLAQARGDFDEAVRHFRAILATYPNSSLREDARRWLQGFGIVVEDDPQTTVVPPQPTPRDSTSVPPPATPPLEETPPAEAQAAPPDSVILPDSVSSVVESDSTRSRTEVVDSTAVDTRPEASSPPPGRNAGAPRGRFAVQLGAFRNEAGARLIASRATSAGFEARLVRVGDSDLIRVRVGEANAYGEIRTLLERVRAAGFEAIDVSDVRRERPAG